MPHKDRGDRPARRRPRGDPHRAFGWRTPHSVGQLADVGAGTLASRAARGEYRPPDPGIEFSRGVWRYQPTRAGSRAFCEGAANMWGSTLSTAKGNPSHHVDERRQDSPCSTRGQGGGYYRESFGKHGPLHNPYAFGYFDHVPHQGMKGGHVRSAALFYDAVLDGRRVAAAVNRAALARTKRSTGDQSHAPRLEDPGPPRGRRPTRQRTPWFATRDHWTRPDRFAALRMPRLERQQGPPPRTTTPTGDRSNGGLRGSTTRNRGIARTRWSGQRLAGLNSSPLAGRSSHRRVVAAGAPVLIPNARRPKWG